MTKLRFPEGTCSQLGVGTRNNSPMQIQRAYVFNTTAESYNYIYRYTYVHTYTLMHIYHGSLLWTFSVRAGATMSFTPKEREGV